MSLRASVSDQVSAFEAECAAFTSELAELCSSLENKDHQVAGLNNMVTDAKCKNKNLSDRVLFNLYSPASHLFFLIF